MRPRHRQQGGAVSGADAPEHLVPLNGQILEPAQHVHIFRPDLGAAEIQEIPPLVRQSLDEHGIVRGEHHALELGKEPAAPPQRHPVQGDFLFPAAFLNGVGDVLLPAAVPECSLHPHDLLVKAHQIPFPYAPEAPAPGQQPDRLQQIGFPLGILPHDEVIPGVRL